MTNLILIVADTQGQSAQAGQIQVYVLPQLLQAGMDDRASLDGDDFPFLRRPVAQAAAGNRTQADIYPIAPGRGIGFYWQHIDLIEPAEALKLVGDDNLLGLQLTLVGHMLEMAAAANAKMGAARLNPIR